MADRQKEALKAAKKEQRQAKWAQRKQTWAQFWQAFNVQRKQDKALIPLMLLAFLGLGAVFFAIGWFFKTPWLTLLIGLMLGAFLAMWIFTRRLESTMFERIEDTPGAAGWALENLRNSAGNVWFTQVSNAATRNMDVVHRVVGTPGVILVGEGDPRRLKSVMQRENRRYTRLLAGVPVYELYVGDGEGQVPLKRLQREVVKLPRNFKKDEVYSINARIEAVTAGNPMQGLPKGPLPKGGIQMAGMSRRARRAAGRSKKG